MLYIKAGLYRDFYSPLPFPRPLSPVLLPQPPSATQFLYGELGCDKIGLVWEYAYEVNYPWTKSIYICYISSTMIYAIPKSLMLIKQNLVFFEDY